MTNPTIVSQVATLTDLTTALLKNSECLRHALLGHSGEAQADSASSDTPVVARTLGADLATAIEVVSQVNTLLDVLYNETHNFSATIGNLVQDCAHISGVLHKGQHTLQCIQAEIDGSPVNARDVAEEEGVKRDTYLGHALRMLTAELAGDHSVMQDAHNLKETIDNLGETLGRY